MQSQFVLNQPLEVILGRAPEWLREMRIERLHLPVRAESRLIRAGILHIRDLTYFSDDDLLELEGLGRVSLREIKSAVADALGRHVPLCPSRTASALKGAAELQFESLVAMFTSEDFSQPLNSIELPRRIEASLEEAGISQIGGLVAHDRSSLRSLKGVGFRSLLEIELALRDFLAKRVAARGHQAELQFADGFAGEAMAAETPTPEPKCDDLAKLLEMSFEQMDPRRADVLQRRTGFKGEYLTLEQLGQRLGLTRERVRQIQRKAVLWFEARTSIASDLVDAMEEIFNNRREPVFAAALPAEHRYFRHLRHATRVVPALLDQFAPGRYFVFDISGSPAVSRISEQQWTATKAQARAFVSSSVGARLDEATVRAALDALLDEKAQELSAELWSYVSSLSHFAGPPDRRRLVAVGRGVEQMVRVVLEDADQALHYSEVAERVAEIYGRQDIRRIANAVADVGILLDRGVYGVPRHLPLSRSEGEYVASLCEALVEDAGSDRQWHAGEFIETLKDTEPLVARLNAYEVSAFLQRYSSMHYTGRQVWVRKRSGRGGVHMRVDIANAVEAVLADEGVSLPATEIFKRIRAIRGVGQHVQIHPRGRVVRVGASLWGLADRDIPWYESIGEDVLQRLAEVLKSRGSAVHVSEAAGVCVDQTDWSFEPWHVYGLAQADDRFRTFSGDYLGLASWTGPNRLTLWEAIDRVRRKGVRYWLLDDLATAVSVEIGRHLEIDTIRWSLRQCGCAFERTIAMWDLLPAIDTAEDLGADAADR